ncbi:MAG: hypothetical protein MUC73_12115 [Cyclobacteriaceae bacterium]|jgi:hypothetical protein|nr:hypothetical protein [Cyclobacteriaceae bacterium]
MRIIGEITHPDCKITLFSWNNRYLIKLEKGLLEQTFKINQYDLTSEEELKMITSELFISKALSRFSEMENDLQEALHSL